MSATTAPPDTVTVEIDRIFDATLERIWHMFTDPDEVSIWGCGDWYNHVDIDLELRVGGVIHHRVTSKGDDEPWTFHGVYQEVEPQQRLVYTFDWKTDWREPPSPSTVAIDFASTDDGKASIHLAHSGVSADGSGSTDTHWNAFLDTLADML
jgi:uncharacterized protein YndB with AHSA1/START domain